MYENYGDYYEKDYLQKLIKLNVLVEKENFKRKIHEESQIHQKRED